MTFSKFRIVWKFWEKIEKSWLISDTDIYLFFEKDLRGGVS